MNLGDFSSVVQLGVGLHAGTALLQSITEFASAPMSRRLARLKAIAEAKAIRDESAKTHVETACDLIGDLEVKKIQFFNEYRIIVQINAAVAIALGLVLPLIAFNAASECPFVIGLLMVGLSLLPAPISMLVLWIRWGTHTEALESAMEDLRTILLPRGLTEY